MLWRLINFPLFAIQEDDDNDRASDGEDASVGATAGAAKRLARWLTGGAKGHLPDLGSGSAALSVRDLELVLCHDLDQLTSWADRRARMTRADLLLLKVVLAAGLYPQLAVPDPANAFRVATKGGPAGPGTEMLFHTPVRSPFLFLDACPTFMNLFVGVSSKHESRHCN